MNSENTSDDASNLDDFANLRDIRPPNVKDQNIPAECFISDNFLVPGEITQYFDKQVLFKPHLSDEIFNVRHDQIRHPSNIAMDCKYEEGNKVEVYMLNAKLNLYGWARSTVRSNVKNTYVVILEERTSYVIVQRDKIRTITTSAYLNNQYLYTFNIPVPQKLQNFASNIEVHDSLCEEIGNPHISYDFENNALVIRSNNIDCESITKMLLVMHFTNLTQRMLLSESIKELEEKYQRMKTTDLLEQFQINPDLLKYVIGENGKTIRKVETIPGVTFIAVLRDTNTVKIYAQNKTALKEACEHLKLEKEIFEVSTQVISKVIGKYGQQIQRIADESKLRHIIIIPNENPASEVTELELIGTSSSIANAKLLLKYYLDSLRDMNELVLASRSPKLLSEAPAVSIPSHTLTRRVISGCSYIKSGKVTTNINGKKLKPELIKFTGNQDLVFYNRNRSRGRAGISSERRSNSARRSQDQLGYPTTQSPANDSEQNAIRQSSQQSNEPVGTSGTSNQAVEIHTADENPKSWLGNRWRTRAHSSADMRTWKYENFNK